MLFCNNSSNYLKNFPEFENYILEIKKEYSYSNKSLILPFYTPTASLPNQKKIGLIGRKPNLNKIDTRKKFGFEDDKKYFLFSFGAYGLEENFNFENLSKNSYLVVSGYEKLNHKKVINIPNAYYPNLVQAVDAVLTKPGYGILSESYFAKQKVLYTERGDFIEYPYLVRALEKHFSSIFITNQELVSLQIEKKFLELEENVILEKVKLKEGYEEIFYEIFLLN